ncbi:CCA tRNA nucleotidyltransferase [Candidatus Uhrbacteria bacterium]|nr:CCA tRNA nucleotidyltransferase [Candidatus Uhrbacteria bacterium]
MNESPPPPLTAFTERLRARPEFRFLTELATEFPGSDAYLVGGVVRDVLLGRDAKDIDLIIRNVPAKALHDFLAARGTVNLVGRNFGVLKFRPQGWPEDAEDLDIALPRTEHADGTGGYRDFEVQADPLLPVEEDLARRDFTMNAMAWDLHRNTLIDPYGGQQDLRARIIRAVRDPQERFAEDRSRILRGLRFAAQLESTIEPATMAAMRAGMIHINDVRPAKELKTPRPARRGHAYTSPLPELEGMEYVTPRETIAKELIKSFVADPVQALDLWDASGAIRELLPELEGMKGCEQPEAFHSEGDVWMHTRRALAVLRSPEFRKEFGDGPLTALVVLGVLFHDIGKPPTQKTPASDGTNRIRFDGHDTVGGNMARAIARRLTLASPFSKDDPRHVDPEDLGWIIDHHLLLLSDPMVMRNATLERYFFHPHRPGDALQRVTFCDGSASIPQGQPTADLAHFRALHTQIARLRALIADRDRLPKAVLNGDDIMQHFHLKPGPHIKTLLEELREQQLHILTQEQRDMTEAEAIEFLQPKITKPTP